ncbi:protein YLS2 [Tripterygium wilfordii]|uniref:Protein YLS2 n=1 Tax=Tripterygium wilfordii TaxID=458696 RepID=A0A7J7DQ30_TRIWF|nr:protein STRICTOSIDINE SYNTHASE-LIKE 4-like [Tripterygium wilfordii]KAF5748417.1 protein YLS2 [Tripterygium wilfordii]
MAINFSRAFKFVVPASLAALLAITLQVFFFSPIKDPNFLQLPSKSSLLPANNLLQGVTKLGEGFLKRPEDVWVDKEGVLYTATGDGWIKRLHKNGSWEEWKKIDSSSILGITSSKDGGLIVCDVEKGVLKVNEEGITFLTSHVNGTNIRFADDVIEASDGSLYFSVASTKFELSNWYLDLLEARPHGQLLKYNPLLDETSIVLDGLGFANGVALSKDEDYLVVCETWRFRCLKYWLKGEASGKTEIFVQNLPGGPDNINLADDGSFWIALLHLTADGLEFVHTSKLAKHLAATFLSLTKLINGTTRKATVVKVAADGTILKIFDDSQGKTISSVTSAFEFEDHLYLGSLTSNFVGKLSLKDA